MVETHVADVGTFSLPEGWHFTQGRYPSEFGDQDYHMVRAAYDRHDEDLGVLSIDISPSHPRLWRQALDFHVEQRLRGLNTVAPVNVDDKNYTPREVPYDAEELLVYVGDDLTTIFRVFRQKSRVITVAFTASRKHFDNTRASRMVHNISESMLIELPVVIFDPPPLDTTNRSVAGLIRAQLPRGFELVHQRKEYTIVPTVILELSPPGTKVDNDRPTLTLSILRLSYLDAEVEIEGVAVPPTGDGVHAGQGAHATVVEVDDDTLAAVRVVRIGGDALTITYASPDYLFEVKKALGLLEKIAETATLTAVPR